MSVRWAGVSPGHGQGCGMNISSPDVAAFVRAAPIAVGFRALFESLFRADALDAWFGRTAVTQYHRELTFSALVDLMAAVTFRRARSVRAAYRANEERWPVSLSAVYQKLAHVEPGVCAKLLADSTEQMRELWALPRNEEPIPGWRAMTVDGWHAAATDHRLKPLRATALAALPGQALVVREHRTGLLVGMVPCEDAHRNERTGLPEVLAMARAGEVWLGDRNLATATLMAGLAAKKAAFIVRRHARTTCEETGEFGPVGTLADGTRIDERAAVVRTADGVETAVRVVRVRLAKPTQDGETVLELFSNLPAAAATADQIAAAYRQRWRIEGAFQVVAVALNGEVPSLGYPKAALFAAALAFVAYNIVLTLKHLAAKALRVPPAALSGVMLAEEIRSLTAGLMVAVPPERWAELGGWTAKQLRAWLAEVFASLSGTKYLKAKTRPKKPKVVTKTGSSGHVATSRLLDEAKRPP